MKQDFMTQMERLQVAVDECPKCDTQLPEGDGDCPVCGFSNDKDYDYEREITDEQ